MLWEGAPNIPAVIWLHGLMNLRNALEMSSLSCFVHVFSIIQHLLNG